MTEELVEKLRDAVTYGYMPRLMREIARQAANTIKAQAAEIERLRSTIGANAMTEELVKRLRFADCKLRGRKWEDNADALCREAADAIEALQAEIKRLTYDGIHTCHDDCPRLPCVQRREIERLRADVRHLMNELQAHKDALAQVKGSSDD
jgi:hypothetical protein